MSEPIPEYPVTRETREAAARRIAERMGQHVLTANSMGLTLHLQRGGVLTIRLPDGTPVISVGVKGVFYSPLPVIIPTVAKVVEVVKEPAEEVTPSPETPPPPPPPEVTPPHEPLLP